MNGPRQLAGGLAATAALTIVGLLPAGAFPRALEPIRDDSLNLADTERMERGYYETLLDAGRRLDRLTLAEVDAGQAPAPAEPPFEETPLAQPTGDLREFVLKAGVSEALRGGRWTTNSRGLRDREYAIPKPPATVRIGMMGDSIGVGWGVDDGRTFEALTEAALDAKSKAEGGPAVEIVNFAVPGHSPGQRWETFRRAGWEFAPDLVIYQATPADPGWDDRRLRGLLPAGIGWDAPQYRRTLARAGLPKGRTFDYYKQALKPYRLDLLEEVYRSIVAGCHERGIPAVFLLIPRVGKPIDGEERSQLLRLAADCGFDALVDLSDAYDGLEPSSLAIAPNDYHPNADGHALLARRLEAALAGRADLLQPRAGDSTSLGDGR